MMKKRTWLMAVTVAAALAATGCASTPASTTVVDTIAANPQLTTLSKLISDHGLKETLSGPGPYTVFAPTDAAFKAIPARAWESLAKDKERVAALLKFHVLPGKMVAADIRSGTAPTLNGANVTLSKSGTFVTIEDAVVSSGDLPASNGVVHLVDRVIVPQK